MQAKNRKLSIFSIFFTFALDTFGSGIIYPIFTPLILDTKLSFFSASDSLFQRTFILGLLIAFFPLSQFFGAPLIGELSDRIGRKRALIFSIIGSIIGQSITSFSISLQSISLLFSGRLISGFFAGNMTICLATLSDLSHSEKERSKNFGMISAYAGLSFFCSIFIGGFFSNPKLDSLFSPALPFAITAFLFLCNLFFIWFSFKETHIVSKVAALQFSRGIHNIFLTLKIPRLNNCYLLYFFFVTAWMSSMQFFPTILLKVYSVTPNQLTFSFLGVGLLWSFSNFFIQRQLAKRFSPQQVLQVLPPILAVILLSCMIPQNYYSYLVHYGLAVMIAALYWSNSLTYVSLNASMDVQGRILGINQSFGAMASILGALVGGFLAAIYPLLVLLFSSLCCFLSYYYLRKNVFHS